MAQYSYISPIWSTNRTLYTNITSVMFVYKAFLSLIYMRGKEMYALI